MCLGVDGAFLWICAKSVSIVRQHKLAKSGSLGSRANGTAKPDSDWDFLVMARSGVRGVLKAETSLHRADVDFLKAKTNS